MKLWQQKKKKNTLGPVGLKKRKQTIQTYRYSEANVELENSDNIPQNREITQNHRGKIKNNLKQTITLYSLLSLFFRLTGPSVPFFAVTVSLFPHIKGCGMGPWLVLVFPCFRENVAATCKIGSFLCSLDNLLQKNVIVLFFGDQISKWRSFEKKGYFWPTFHIF